MILFTFRLNQNLLHFTTYLNKNTECKEIFLNIVIISLKLYNTYKNKISSFFTNKIKKG